jgi:cysteinyl-tRNA synthetase
MQDEHAAAQYADLLKDFQAQKQRDGRLDAALTDKDRQLADLQVSRQALEQQLESTSQDLQNTKVLLAAKTGELAQMQTAKASDSMNLVALQYQVADLTQKLTDQTQSLDRERQLLANGRDIRDIIGARNLHILDVYDTDSQGNTRKSFARAFYTEHKSLVFYAYDLPTRGADEGKFVYTAWGESNGNRNRVQKLGILLNDDKGQKRWALNFSDPKVLSEIDSVFVTLERVDMDSEQPKGKRMLTAYLDSQVNHP